MKNPYLEKLLGEREKILLITRQHWFILFRNILAEMITIIALGTLITATVVFWAPTGLGAVGYLILIFPIISLLKDVLIWTNHQFIVTTQRVIQIAGVFNKSVIDSSLEKVNDVKMVQTYSGRLFNFADIEILTASELGINRFTNIAKPVEFKTAMLNAKQKLEAVKLDEERHSKMDIPLLITRLDNLRKQGLITDEEFAGKKAELLKQL